MTSPEHEKKCSKELKRAQNKVTTLKCELKMTKEELISERATLAEKHIAVVDVDVIAIAMEEVFASHVKLDNKSKELVELQQVAQGLVPLEV